VIEGDGGEDGVADLGKAKLVYAALNAIDCDEERGAFADPRWAIVRQGFASWTSRKVHACLK